MPLCIKIKLRMFTIYYTYYFAIINNGHTNLRQAFYIINNIAFVCSGIRYNFRFACTGHGTHNAFTKRYFYWVDNFTSLAGRQVFVCCFRPPCRFLYQHIPFIIFQVNNTIFKV